MGIGRREFLGVAAGLTVGATASPALWRAARDFTRMSQDPLWLPGLPRGPIREITSMSLACPSALGVKVLLNEGRPLIIRGDPEHPLSQGGITPPAQAEARARFHPDRVLTPLLKNGQGVFEPVSWAVALDLLATKLVAARDQVMAVGPASRGTLGDLLAAFLVGLGSEHIFRMPSEADLAKAAATLMGGSGQPGYDLDNSGGLVLLGADAFESMPSSPHFRKAWGERTGVPSTFFGPTRSATAALCRDWIPLPAGEEAGLAMGIAWHLADMGRIAGAAPDLMEFVDLTRQRFSPADVLSSTGLGPDILRTVAMGVAGGALAVPGSFCGEGLGLAPFVAGLALSVMSGRVNRPGGVFLTGPVPGVAWLPDRGRSGRFGPGSDSHTGPGPDTVSNPAQDTRPYFARDLAGRLKDIALGLIPAPAVLLLVECDPAEGMPSTELAARAVVKAGFKVAFASLPTPSTHLCDLILPAPMPLERFDDAATPYGLAFASYGLARPLVRPLGSARHPGDVLLELAVRLGKPLGPASFAQALRQRVADLEAAGGYVVRPAPDGVMPWRVLVGQAQPAPEAGLWRALLEGRAWFRPEPVHAELSCGARFLAEALAPEAIDLDLPLKLAPQPTWRTGLAGFPGPCMLTGQADQSKVGGGCLMDETGLASASGGVRARAVSGPRPGETGGGKPLVRLNAATAREARAHGGDLVRVSSPAGAVEAMLAIDESVMDGHVALDLGLGQGQGGYVRRLAAFAPEPGSGVSVWAGCRVSLELL
jgi:anaerobic selenocysteine-containing dehydrogenase